MGIFTLWDELREGECVSDITLRGMIGVYYGDNPVGGHAHIVFDERAVVDETIKYCIQDSILHGDWICAGLLLELLKRHPGVRELIVQ